MIRKLRLRFILLAMAAFLGVLIAIIAAINLVNYHTVVEDADELLAILSENRGSFPPLHGGNMPPDLSPETPYESRYFSVTLNQTSGSIVQVETSRITAVTTSDAIDYAQDVLEEGDHSGFEGVYRYTVTAEGDLTRITFLDCGRKLDAFYRFLLISIGLSLAGYLLGGLLIVFFSGRITRPVLESHEKQKQFITDAGHELKTPLSIIRADADVLAMDLGENEWVEDIQAQTARLAALTNDLVWLSRMEENQGTLPMVQFPLSDVVAEAAASFHAPAVAQNRELACRIQPMLSLKGDEKAIRQLTGILLDNALKYSPGGSTVSLALEKQAKGICLTVENRTCAPIPRESLPLLFERFYRTDPSRSSQTGGHGIGLSVAKAIVTSHNGRIQASCPEEDTLRISVLFPGL